MFVVVVPFSALMLFWAIRGLCILIATTNFAGTDVPAAVLTYLGVQVIVSTLVGMYFKRTTEAAA